MGHFGVYDYKMGLTMGIGVVIICACIYPDTVESLFAYFMTPALTLVVWCAICPYNSGMATLMYPLLIFGTIIKFIAYVIMVYVTYAVTAPGYGPSTAKAITLCTISTVVVGFLHLIRVRFPAMDFSCMVAQLLPAMMVFGSYWERDTLPSMGMPWRMVVLLAIPTVTGSVVSMFLVPNPAGPRSIELLGDLLELTAGIQSSLTKQLLLAEIDEKTGKIQTSSPDEDEKTTATTAGGCKKEVDSTFAADDAEIALKENGYRLKEGNYIGVSSALESKILPLRQLDIQAWQLTVGIKGLLMFTPAELNVYGRPHVFPNKAFRDVLTPVRSMEQVYGILLTSMQDGQVPMRAFPLLRNELEEVRAAVAESCSKLKSVIVDGYEYEKGLRETVPRVEAACVALTSKLAENGKLEIVAQSGESGDAVINNDFLVARELISLVVLAGKELCRAWERTPALISKRQPDAAASAELYFNKEKSNLSIEGTSGNVEETTRSTSQGVPPPPPPGAAGTAATPKAIPQPPPQPFREIVKVSPTCSSLQLKLYNLSMRTGIHSWHLKIAFHMTFVFAVAATLNVIRPVWLALDEHTYWILVTILVISDVTTGGIIDNGVQRIGGTLVGALGVAATAGFTYLANGSSYEGANAAAKITTTAIVAIWMGVMQLLLTKYSPRWYKFFYICKLMVPLIALMDSSGSNVWPHISYRIANTCIGIGLHTFASIVCFPVTADDHIKEKTASCLLNLAEMVDAVTLLPLSKQSSSDVLDAADSKKSGGGCLGKWRKQKGKKASSDKQSLRTSNGQVENGDGDVEAAAAEESESILEDFPGRKEVEDKAGDAAKATIASEMQLADASLLDVIKLRDIVDKQYFVSEFYYSCVNGKTAAAGNLKTTASSEAQGNMDFVKKNNDDTNNLEQKQQKQQETCRFTCFGLTKKLNRRPPVLVAHLDQLIFHLKHNIVYTNVALHIREWLRARNVLSKNPEAAAIVRAFGQQAAECFRALRLSILKLVTPEEALKTVYSLQDMTSDIIKLCNSSERFGPDGAIIVHTMLVTCRNIEFLFRATDRAIVTHSPLGVVSAMDKALERSEVTIISLLDLKVTEAVVNAVEIEEDAASVADGKKGGAVTTRDGAREIFGLMQRSNV